MRDLVLSRLPRSLTIDGTTYSVEPPTVRDTCELFACRSGCLALEASYVLCVRTALRRWWGDEIMSALQGILFPPSSESFRMLYDRYIVPMSLEGCPVKLPEGGMEQATDDEEANVESYIDSIVSMDIRRRLALYCSVFPAAEPSRTYERMSFSMFVSMFEEVDRIVAYHNWERIYAQSLLQGSDKNDSKKRLDEYSVRAGFDPDQGKTKYTRAELEADPEKMEHAKRIWLGATEYARRVGLGGPQGDA